MRCVNPVILFQQVISNNYLCDIEPTGHIFSFLKNFSRLINLLLIHDFPVDVLWPEVLHLLF